MADSVASYALPVGWLEYTGTSVLVYTVVFFVTSGLALFGAYTYPPADSPGPAPAFASAAAHSAIVLGQLWLVGLSVLLAANSLEATWGIVRSRKVNPYWLVVKIVALLAPMLLLLPGLALMASMEEVFESGGVRAPWAQVFAMGVDLCIRPSELSWDWSLAAYVGPMARSGFFAPPSVAATVIAWTVPLAATLFWLVVLVVTGKGRCHPAQVASYGSQALGRPHWRRLAATKARRR